MSESLEVPVRSARRPSLTTRGTGHPRLHVSHAGHLYAGAVTPPPIRLGSGATVIGSAPDVDVSLDGLAPRHADVRCDAEDEFVVTALDGPMTVNGAPRTTARLHTGDLLRLGPWAFSFSRDESTDHAAQPHFRVLEPAKGWVARWERALFLATGPGTRVRQRRHSDRVRASVQRRDEP